MRRLPSIAKGIHEAVPDTAQQVGGDEPPPRVSVQCRAGIRECLVRSTDTVGGGRSPLAFGNRMIARSPEEVRKLVSAKRWARKHLEAFRRDFGQQALFDALFSAFTQRPPVPYVDQQAPGDYLLELKPRGAQDLQSLIRASLAGWNLSIEQLPFYFRDSYGIQAVRLAVERLDLDARLDAVERKALDTYRYWLRIPKAEPGAPPNGGPAKRLGDLSAGDGPPSVS